MTILADNKIYGEPYTSRGVGTVWEGVGVLPAYLILTTSRLERL